MVYWENLPPIAIERAPTGFRIRFAAIAERTYDLERASTINGSWSTIATITASSRGIIEYIDTDQLTCGAFYRVRTPH